MAVKKMLIITPKDNVGIVLEDAAPGDVCVFEGIEVVAKEAVPFPHKISLIDLAAEDNVIKYGEAIGHAIVPIPAGCLIHSHNMGCRRGTNDEEGRV